MHRAPGGDRRRPARRSEHGLTGRDVLVGVAIVCTLVGADALVNEMSRVQDREAATGRITTCDDPLLLTFDRGAVPFTAGGKRYTLTFGEGNWSAVCRGSNPTADVGDAGIAHIQGCNDIGGIKPGASTADVVSPRRNHYRVRVSRDSATVCMLGE